MSIPPPSYSLCNRPGNTTPFRLKNPGRRFLHSPDIIFYELPLPQQFPEQPSHLPAHFTPSGQPMHLMPFFVAL
jgi:hypothetical protein